jgi:hypothetical protein
MPDVPPITTATLPLKSSGRNAILFYPLKALFSPQRHGDAEKLKSFFSVTPR